MLFRSGRSSSGPRRRFRLWLPAAGTPPPNAGYGQAYQGGGIRIDSDGRGSGRGYGFEIHYGGAFALAIVKLQAEQSIQAEAGAMVSMSGNIELQSQMKGGLMGAFKRVVGGESAFISTFTARSGPGEVAFAPGAPGDVAAIEMSNQLFYVQSSSYLAGDTSLALDTSWGGSRTFFGGEGQYLTVRAVGGGRAVTRRRRTLENGSQTRIGKDGEESGTSGGVVDIVRGRSAARASAAPRYGRSPHEAA